jgi:DnaJ-class molecular chaperone
MSMSLYHILGVGSDATTQDIKKAYRALSLDCHPDRNIGKCAADFHNISNAYDILADADSRKTYDASICLSRPTSGITETTSNEVGIYRPVFTGKRNESSTYIVSKKTTFPEPIVVTALLSLEQCYLGCSIPITVTRQTARIGNRDWASQRDDRCSETETITTYFPQGVGDKDIIVLEGFGDSTDGKGDVKVIIQVKPDPVFSVYGLDLVFQKHLTLKEALCGFSFSQLHPCGKTVVIENITMPSVIYPGYRRTMVGMGMIREGIAGNMVVEFIVDFPQRLCSEQIRALAAAL